MFARVALRMAQQPLVRSPYARPASLLASYVPAFHVRAGHRRALALGHHARRAAAAPSLLETAVRLRRAAAEAAAELARPYAGLDPADSTVLLR